MSNLHDVPDKGELVAAVEEFLRDDLLPATEGRLKFHTLVAANVLRIVGRELDLGQQQELEHGQRLSTLGFEGDRALASAIRQGHVDHTDPALIAALRASTIAKLEVADPSYLEPSDQAELSPSS